MQIGYGYSPQVSVRERRRYTDVLSEVGSYAGDKRIKKSHDIKHHTNGNV